MKLWLFVMGALTGLLALFGLRRDAKRAGAVEQKKRQELAAASVQKQLEKIDRELETKEKKKAQAIQREYERAKSAIKKGEVAAIDANALIDRSKGGDW